MDWMAPKEKRFINDRVLLWFPPGSMAPDGYYLMRGGVCWPAETEGGLEGYAVVCGRHEETDTVYVFDERTFLTVDHVLGMDQTVEFSGIAPWFTEQWARWFCRTYYWHQGREINQRYLVQVARSAMANPKPVFSEIPLELPRTKAGILTGGALHLVLSRDVTGRLKYGRGRGFHDALSHRMAESERVYPALHAVLCALVGMEQYRLQAAEVGT